MKHFLRFRGCYCPISKRPLTHKAIIVSLLLAFTISYAQGQPSSATRLNGTVFSAETRQPLQGASIKITGRGGALPKTPDTQADAEGKFALYTSLTEGIIQVSYIGYQTKTIQFNPTATSPFTISLEKDENVLEEVVLNAGYYETTKRLSTGNIARVDAKTIAQQPVSNPLAALIGRVPGLEITQQTGVPGGNFTVRIRGQNSISNGNEPLYIIDGVPFNGQTLSSTLTSGVILGAAGESPLNGINPQDILRIEVLKDADATAIYGSRGANGVILVTTKQGQPGPSNVSASVYTGISQVGRKTELLSNAQYLEMRREAFENDGLAPTVENAPDLLLWDTTRYTDWQERLIGGQAGIHDVQLSLSGGGEQMQIRVAGGYHKTNTVFPGDHSASRASVSFSADHQGFNRKLRVSTVFNYGANRSTLFNQDLTTEALTLPPNAPEPENGDGSLNWAGSTWTNPLSYLKHAYWSNSNNLTANVKLHYSLAPNLSIQVNMGYTRSGLQAGNTQPLSALDPATLTGNEQHTSRFSDNGFQNRIAEPQINWNKSWWHGTIHALVGTTAMDQENTGLSHTATGYSDEALMRSISNAAGVSVSDSYTRYRYLAVYGRINYTLLNRYSVNLTGRRDGSSRFGPDKRYANFGALGAAWIITEESWLRNGSVLSFAKLRGSYGLSGNDQLGDYLFLDTYAAANLYQGIRGINPARLYNPELEWEANYKLEGGLELRFAGDRLHMDVSYFRNRSTNQLLAYPLPANTGFTSIQRNLAATIQNKGVELVIGGSAISGPVFSWTTDVNISIPRSRLIAFPGLETSSYASRYIIGEPLLVSRLYPYTGVDPLLGLHAVADVNGDGMISAADRTETRFRGTRFSGGLSNSLAWKGLSLDVFFQFVRQDGLTYIPAIPPGRRANQPVSVMDRWQQEGDHSLTQKFSTLTPAQTAYNRLSTSTYSVSDLSFVRLKNLSLAYTLPGQFTQRYHLRSLRFFVQGQNLLLFTPYPGLDPEHQSPFVLPPLRTITGGFNLTF